MKLTSAERNSRKLVMMGREDAQNMYSFTKFYLYQKKKYSEMYSFITE